MRVLLLFFISCLAMMEPCGGPRGYKIVYQEDNTTIFIPTTYEDELRYRIECFEQLYFAERRISHALRRQIERSWCEWIKQFLPF